MREEFLHHIWKFGLFRKDALTTTDGRSVVIIHPGQHNHQSGPDFFNARIEIDGTLWVGNVEIHVDERDWFRHDHHHDEAYDNVILHVVYAASPGGTTNTQGREIPVLSLDSRISEKQYRLYLSFLASKQFIPCAALLNRAPKTLVALCQDRMLVNRLERKSKDVLLRLDRNRGDWQQTLFEQLAMNFGFKVNAQPMEMMARSLPVNLLGKYQDNLLQLEALLFGQSGWLDERLETDYALQLQNEYAFLRHKHKLISIEAVAWKFGRMRPANFPTIRVAQLAALVHKSKGLFRAILEIENPAELAALFDVTASPYWSDYHHFDKRTASNSVKHLGVSSRDIIIINTVVPFLFAYSLHLDDQQYADKGISLLESRPPESNRIVLNMHKLGFALEHAAHSQSLLELKSQYCDEKKCLHCAIGTKLLNEVESDSSN